MSSERRRREGTAEDYSGIPSRWIRETVLAVWENVCVPAVRLAYAVCVCVCVGYNEPDCDPFSLISTLNKAEKADERLGWYAGGRREQPPPPKLDIFDMNQLCVPATGAEGKHFVRTADDNIFNGSTQRNQNTHTHTQMFLLVPETKHTMGGREGGREKLTRWAVALFEMIHLQ